LGSSSGVRGKGFGSLGPSQASQSIQIMFRKRLHKRPAGDSASEPVCDSAGNPTPQCLVCLERLLPAVLRGLLPCGHAQFCHDCIEEWSRTSNKCPLCAVRFHTLKLVAQDEDGKMLELTTSEVADQTLAEDPGVSWELVACQLCGSDEDEHILLLCDSCNAGYHTSCLGMDCLPYLDAWYCDGCLPLLTQEQAEQQWIAMERVGRARRHKRITKRTIEPHRRRLRQVEIM